MTWRKREIMDMAREAGIRDCTCSGEFGCLEAFAKLVREDALAQPEQEPVACKHEWFRTGAMQSWEYRCINCGAEAKLMEKNNDS